MSLIANVLVLVLAAVAVEAMSVTHTWIQPTIHGVIPDTGMQGEEWVTLKVAPSPQWLNSSVPRYVTPLEDTACPDDVITDPEKPLGDRAGCPWVPAILHLPCGRYFPSTVPTVQCKACRGCLRGGLGCTPVHSDVTLLEATGYRDGVKAFRQVKVPVTVACVCATRMTEVGSELDTDVAV